MFGVYFVEEGLQKQILSIRNKYLNIIPGFAINHDGMHSGVLRGMQTRRSLASDELLKQATQHYESCLGDECANRRGFVFSVLPTNTHQPVATQTVPEKTQRRITTQDDKSIMAVDTGGDRHTHGSTWSSVSPNILAALLEPIFRANLSSSSRLGSQSSACTVTSESRQRTNFLEAICSSTHWCRLRYFSVLRTPRHRGSSTVEGDILGRNGKFPAALANFYRHHQIASKMPCFVGSRLKGQQRRLRIMGPWIHKYYYNINRV